MEDDSQFLEICGEFVLRCLQGTAAVLIVAIFAKALWYGAI